MMGGIREEGWVRWEVENNPLYALIMTTRKSHKRLRDQGDAYIYTVSGNLFFSVYHANTYKLQQYQIIGKVLDLCNFSRPSISLPNCDILVWIYKTN